MGKIPLSCRKECPYIVGDVRKCVDNLLYPKHYPECANTIGGLLRTLEGEDGSTYAEVVMHPDRKTGIHPVRLDRMVPIRGLNKKGRRMRTVGGIRDGYFYYHGRKDSLE